MLELFTSTRCPSCPPADENHVALSRRPDVIALACHVSYFNRGQTTDPSARRFCDARQNIYKMVLHTSGLFTPMMVIDGQDYMTGRKKEELNTALIKSGKDHFNRKIDLNLKGQYLEIRLPLAYISNKAEVWLIEYRPDQGNTVTDMRKLMDWNGQAYVLGSPAEAGASYAVIAQDYKIGIIASGKAGP